MALFSHSLETRRQKPGRWQDWFLWSSEGEPSVPPPSPLVVADNPWCPGLVDASLIPTSASVFTRPSLSCLILTPSSFSYRTPVIRFRPYKLISSDILNSITPAKTLVPNRSRSKVAG